ncbi:hypothetical protein J3E64_000700 [Sphingobium sp. OAS761]|uniref:hypothetical protein n=1 Tax=Sphingobium sp. OAS761 TaxID=2817901 RepID=UPI0020A03A57|nr:hypothetical protein [Sphingobium sp. OAS761]MCP1469029.1 hypothetical protein [Sphingobium sp. OAS761]
MYMVPAQGAVGWRARGGKPAIVCMTLLLSVLMAGCGMNRVRVETAGNVSAASSAVVAKARSAIDDAEARRARAYLTLIASDPHCSPVDPVYIFVPLRPPVPNDPRAPLCANGADAVLANYRVKSVSFSPASSEALKPTVLLIGAIGDYGAALARIVAEPKPDIRKQMDDIAAKAAEAKTIAEGLTGTSLPALPDLKSKQVEAAVALLDFVAALSHEAGQVRDIRAALRAHGDKVEQAIASLPVQIRQWQEVATAGYSQVTVDNLRTAYENERGKLDFDGRLALLTLYRQSVSDREKVKPTTDAFLKSVEQLDREQADLRHALDNPTDAQRAKAADESGKRIIDALGLVAKAVSAWGVI